MLPMNRALGLLLPALTLALACSTATPQTDPSEPGLRQDYNVQVSWGDADQISYYNTLETDAPWLTSSDYVSFPRAVAIDEEINRLYVSEQHGLRVVDLETGELSLMAEGIGIAHGLAVAPDGRVFVVDATRESVLVFSRNNEYLYEIVGKEPKGIAIDAARDRLYVADAKLQTVTAWTLDGEYLFDITPEGESWALPLQPSVNSNGDVFVVHWGETTVHAFDADGNYLRGFGTKGTYPTQFTRPKGIAIDSDDNVYVTDAAFGNVQVFTAEGELAIWFGTGGAGVGNLSIPGFMAFDSQDRLYVPEYGNHRVQIFQYNGAGQ